MTRSYWLVNGEESLPPSRVKEGLFSAWMNYIIIK